MSWQLDTGNRRCSGIWQQRICDPDVYNARMMLHDWECSAFSAISALHSSCRCRCATWTRAAAGTRAMCRRRWGSQTFLTPTTQNFSYAPCTLVNTATCSLSAFSYMSRVQPALLLRRKDCCCFPFSEISRCMPASTIFKMVSPWKDACFSEFTKRGASLLCFKAVPQTCMHAIAHHSDSPC